MVKAYISGRITGLPYDEVERAFFGAEAVLEALDYEVLNPLKNGLDRTASWREHMTADIAMLMQADVVFMLPDWNESKGARIEHYIANEMKKTVYYNGL